VSDRGFTVVELLVAALIFLGIAGVVVALAGPMHDSFDRGLSGADLPTRGRAGLELLLGDLRQTGAGAAIGDAPALMDLTAVVSPLAPTEGSWRAVSVMRIPNDAAQAVLRDTAETGMSILHLDEAAPCPGQDGTCGFRPGAAAVIYDSARLEGFSIAGVSDATATLAMSSPLVSTFNPGAIVAAVETATYSVRSAGDGSARLTRTTTGGAEQTIADHVVDFEIAVFGLASSPSHREGDVPTYGAAPPAVGVDDMRDGWPAAENCTMTLDAEGRRVSRLACVSAGSTSVCAWNRPTRRCADRPAGGFAGQEPHAARTRGCPISNFARRRRCGEGEPCESIRPTREARPWS
jgi:Tfp pilus assembly protein PilW